MRHRIVGITGFGNPDKVLLDNTGKLDKKFADDALDTYFSEEEYFDFKVTDDLIVVGVEPAYQHEKIKIIGIAKDKDKSFIRSGTSFGPYGSRIVSTTREFKSYKNYCKFTRFVNKWHGEFFDGRK